MWKGAVIQESLDDAALLAKAQVIGTREYALEGTRDGRPLHFHKVIVSDEEKHGFVVAAARAVKQGPWYIHLCRDDRIVVVYNDHIFEFSIKDKLKLQSAQKYGVVVGIPEAQLDFGHLVQNPYG